jgi:hypothetical protein
MKVLIWIPNYDWKLPIDLVIWLENPMLPDWRWYSKAYVTRTPIHMARNILIERMIEWWFDYLIMIDDDELPMSKDAFYRLLSHWKDMISWVVRLRKKKENLCILHKELYEEEDKYWMYRYTPYKEIPNKWLFKIDNAWTWLVCLSRKVCEFMYKKYAKEPYESKQITYVKQSDWVRKEFWYNTLDIAMKDNGQPYLCRRVLSEDYLFFERAIANWFELRCDWQVKAIHFGDPEQIIP